MNYSQMLRKAINNSNMSLSEIAAELRKHDLRTTKFHLSKLQNGKLPPAGDKLNDAIAKVLGIDPIEFKAAAYREKISPDVLEKLQSNSA